MELFVYSHNDEVTFVLLDHYIGVILWCKGIPILKLF